MYTSSEDIKYLQATHGFQVVGVTFAFPQTLSYGQKNPICIAENKGINHPGSLLFTKTHSLQQEIPCSRVELKSPGLVWSNGLNRQ